MDLCKYRSEFIVAYNDVIVNKIRVYMSDCEKDYILSLVDFYLSYHLLSNYSKALWKNLKPTLLSNITLLAPHKMPQEE